MLFRKCEFGKFRKTKRGDNGLKLNPSKCVQCMFTLKGNVVTDLEFKANINGNTLSEVEAVPYLGVTCK